MQIKKNKVWVLFLLMFVLEIGCNHSTLKKPEHLIDATTMIQILTDIHLADAICEHKAAGNARQENELTKKYYKQIFDNYHISEKIYKESFHFYETQPKILNEIYEKVIVEFSKKEGEVGK